MNRFALATFLFLAGGVNCFAATEVSVASGNIGTAATFALIEPNSFTNANTTTLTLTTSFAPSSPTTFTVSATTTVAGLGIKLATTPALPSGTLTCRIETGGTQVPNAITGNIPISSLPTATSAANDDGGWVFMAFASTATLATAVSYGVQCETSAASQVALQVSTSTLISVALYTSTNQAPAAGDNFFVAGTYSSGGAQTANIVTINTTSGTTYGSETSFSATTNPAVSVAQGGTLCIGAAGTCGPAASTAYVYQWAGQTVIYNSGTVDFGTSSSAVPSTGSATITEVVTTEGSTGLNVQNGGTLNIAGSSGGRNVVKTTLAAAASGGATSLTTTASTGWLSGDSIYVASSATDTAQTVAGYLGDATSLTANASGTGLTVSAITNAHSATTQSYTSSSTGNVYNFPMLVDVVLLNRNVVIQGNGASANGYIYGQASSNFASTWTEFSQISGLTTGKRGLEFDTGPAGSFSLTYFSIINSHDSTLVLAPTNTNFGGTSGAYVRVQHGVLYNDVTTTSTAQAEYGIGVLTGTLNPYWMIDDVAVILCGTGTANSMELPIFLQSFDGQFTNITASGNSNANNDPALYLDGTYSGAVNTVGGGVNTWGPITLYTNIGYPIGGKGAYGPDGTLSGLYVWHEAGRFNLSTFTSGNLTIDPFYMNVSTFGIYNFNGGSNLTVRNGIIEFDNTVNCAGGSCYPLANDSFSINVTYDNMEICPFGAVGGVTLSQCSQGHGNYFSVHHDLAAGGKYSPSTTQIWARNTSTLNLGTAYPTQDGEESYYGPQEFIVQDCAACSPIIHGAWITGGFLSYDTAITHTSGYSLRMTPRVNTVSGYISSGSGSSAAGNTLTITSGTPSTPLGDFLFSNGSGYTSANITAGSGTSFTVSGPTQSIGSPGSPVQFQSYFPQYTGGGTLRHLQSAPHGYGVKVAVKSGGTASVCVYLRPSSSSDSAPPWGGSAVTYSADNPRILVRQNPYMGVQSDTVLSFTNSPTFTAGNWTQACATTPTAPADGEFELVVDADQTFTSNAGGWMNVAEWSCSTTCNSGNGSQFWWNGTPAQFVSPSSSGGGQANIIGGTYLLKRDLDPPSNDNTPAWVYKAA